MNTIRAIDLTSINRADTIRFESLATTEMSNKFGVDFAAHYVATGYIKHMHNGTASLTRGAAFVTVVVDSINGNTIEPVEHEYVWGAHVFVEIMDPDEYEPEDSEDDSEVGMASIADMPDPEDDGVMCEFPTCTTIATRVGLRQIANPSADHPTGVQSDDPVCEYHAMTWSGLWGTWEIEDDWTHGVGVGGRGPVSKLESERRYGNISDDTFADEVASVMAGIASVSTGVVSLDKSDGGFVEADVQPEQATTAGKISVGMAVRFTHRATIITGTVEAVDPFEDSRGRIGVYLRGDSTKYRMRPSDSVIHITPTWSGGLFSHA